VVERRGPWPCVFALVILSVVLLLAIIPGSWLHERLFSREEESEITVVPLYNGLPIIACGEAAYNHTKVRSSTQIAEDNTVGELSQGMMVPILEFTRGNPVYGSDDRWDKVWWEGAERFVYSELLRERDIDKCIPKRSSVDR
jgi:hypothetical protein